MSRLLCRVAVLLLAVVPVAAAAQEGGEALWADSLQRAAGLEKTVGHQGGFLMEKPFGTSSASQFFRSPEYPVNLLEARPPSALHTGLTPSGYPPYAVHPSPLFKGDYNTEGVLWQRGRGTWRGYGMQQSVPGLGRFNSAAFSYGYAFDSKLSLELMVSATKMATNRFTGQAFNASGMLVYQPQDRLRFKVFGGGDVGGMMHGMRTYSYGATMGWDMTDRFGMEVGVQRYYDAMRGRWQTVPVVVPYYRFDNFTLGLDVGGLLYEVLRNVLWKDDRRDGGPTIAPPRNSLPAGWGR